MTTPDHPIPFAEPLSEEALGRLREDVEASFADHEDDCRDRPDELLGDAEIEILTVDLAALLARYIWLEDAYRWFSESGQVRKDRAR